MHIHWGNLLVVFVVSFGSAVAVVTLVTFALVGLSSRAQVASGDRPAAMSPGVGTAVAALCLTAAAAIVLFGLYIIVA